LAELNFISCGQSGANYPQKKKGFTVISVKFNPCAKINVDNTVRFRYTVVQWLRSIEESICCAEAGVDTQFAFFDSSALKKQLPIFYL